MEKVLSYFLDYAEAEFDGESFNGPSLMATLDGLSARAAANVETWEGYSAWSVAVHVAYYKFYFVRAILGPEKAGPFPYPKDEHGFGDPTVVSEEDWAALRGYLRRIHSDALDALRAIGAAGRLGDSMPRWDMPYGKAIAWLVGHDTYHAAQIRSMGVPGLQKKREA